jgi:hypothetical protein
VVVRLRGEAGVPDAGALEASLLRLTARRPAWVTFDLSKLRLLSSIAVGALADYLRGAVRAGSRVALAPGLHPAVREALARAGLLARFEAVGGGGPCAGPGPVAEDARKVYPDVDEVERTYGITWDQLAELEPQLKTLLWQARRAGARCLTIPEVERTFLALRNELAELIGFTGKHHWHPILGSAGAYEVAYWKLYDAAAGLLPRCAAGADEAPENPGGGTGSGPCPREPAARRGGIGSGDGPGTC